MLRPHALLGALLLAHAAIAAAQVHEGKTIVKARLVADTLRVQPGQPFLAGVQLTVEPGWHVYWENPGDTALPVEVSWDLPEGVRAGALRWPAPEKYEEEGGVTVFGYENQAMLLTTITTPRSYAAPLVPLHAKASWLVCEKLCLPGEASLALTLPTGDASPSPDAGTIRRMNESVPLEGSRHGVRITRAVARREGERWRIEFAVAAPSRILHFFPRSIDGFAIEHGGIRVTGDTVELTALPDEPQLKPERIGGVVVTDRGSFDVSADLKKGESSGVPLPGDSADEPGRGDPQKPPLNTTATNLDPGSDPGPASTSARPDSSRPESTLSGEDWLAADFNSGGPPARRLSLPMLLLLAALGGLLLNVMPCVLPVLSLKILSFVHQAGHDPKRTRRLGLMFGAGVLVSFWILVAAVASLRATAAQVGWGFQFQSPLFVMVMSVVVLVFAMNLFGVFEIAGPSFSGPVAGAQGPGGAFIHGVLATVLATPCTAPFLGTAIGFAFTQPLPVLFLAFTAAAAGLAAPYVVLSWHPAWLRWLPRPGAWMIRFKQAMGFVLLGTVVWLLSVLASQLGPEGIIWSLVFLTFVAFAVWLLGQSRTLLAWTAAVALVAGGYYWTLEHELRWREPVETAPMATARPGAIEWEPFSLADVRARVERGETVFIDFTADWCWSCKVNERTVLAAPSVQDHIRRLDVTTVKADWTRRNPEITRLLAKFGRAGVPFYAVFPAGRLTEPIALSEVITPSSVIAALDQAGPSRTERN